ncbi:hypothetical protein EHJ15_06175 [Cronobacter muytjensii]|nr:hypothetical protein [Cronobacter muytjensii]
MSRETPRGTTVRVNAKCKATLPLARIRKTRPPYLKGDARHNPTIRRTRLHISYFLYAPNIYKCGFFSRLTIIAFNDRGMNHAI